MSKHLSFFLFLLLNLSISSVKADVGQLSAGERVDNRLQQILSCESDADCDDQDPCTNEICLINGINDIRSGRCISSGRRENCGAIDCNDNDACTLDSIGEDGNCAHVHNNVPECSPGAFVCEEFPGLQCCHFHQDCNDNNPNTNDSCVNMESETGYCQFQIIERPDCDDGNACTVDQVDSNGHCSYSSIPDCGETETPPPNTTKPKEENPVSAITPSPTANPDYMFGGGCAFSVLPSDNGFLWIFTTIFFIFWMKRKRMNKEGRV